MWHAEADWTLTPAQWVDLPWAARAIDLRDRTLGSLADVSAFPLPSETTRLSVGTTASGLHVALHTDPREPRSGCHRPAVLVLSRDLADGQDRRDQTVAIIVRAATAWNELGWHGLYLDDGPLTDEHLDGVHAALLDPDRWHPGLGSADLTTDIDAQYVLTDLLAVAHPRVPDSAAVRPFGILLQDLDHHTIVEWVADTPDLSLTEAAAFATVNISTVDGAQKWLRHFPLDLAIHWILHGPIGQPKVLARLAAAGWEPPSAMRALCALEGADKDVEVDTLIEYADLPPLFAVLACEAGLSAAEARAVLADAAGDVSAVNVDGLRAMAALRCPA